MNNPHKNNWVRICLFLSGFLISANISAANDKTFFWKATSAEATVYLMGSIHFADSSFYPLRKDIENAFTRSNALVVELDVNKIDHDAYNRLLVQKGVYKDGTTIKDALSEETWLQLHQRLQQLDISYDHVKNYKPGVLVLTLMAMQVMQMGLDPQLGIDAYFLRKAARQEPAKKIIELETLEQQLNLFLDIPNGDLLLKESLYTLGETEILMADLVRFWKQGDVAQMSKLLFEDALNEYPAFSSIYDSLIYARNRQMAKKIEDMLSTKGVYFVVVGSAHLIGDKGIVDALIDKGYEVERR